jgi:tRNA modification GTPase
VHPLDDTIAAIASPPGGAARGIVRLSGPQAIELATCFIEPGGTTLRLSHPTQVVAGSLRLPGLHSPLPCDVYLWCGRPACTGAGETPAPQSPAPQVRSYTGQPVAEIHTLGSPPLLELVLRSLCAAGARLAGPGEFTLRAFLAGRIDLTQAEAVLGVIDAADARDLNVALGQLAGGLARPLHRLRDGLLDLLAHLEAGFDFADEDLSFITHEELDRRLAEAETGVASILGQMASRGEESHAARAVLVGRPNTGKSSLFNALAGDRAALVSDLPGTTRDYLIAELDLDGVKCRLVDAAGMPLAVSDAENAVESAAQSAAEGQRRAADVEVLCLDCTRPLDDWERNELRSDNGKNRLVVLTKCDAPRRTDCTTAAVETSALSRQGIETLRRELRERAIAAAGGRGEAVAGTAARCRESLRLAGESLAQARRVASGGQDELVAAELHIALAELGKVVGAVYTDDVLDRIFSRFCVGK